VLAFALNLQVESRKYLADRERGESVFDAIFDSQTSSSVLNPAVSRMIAPWEQFDRRVTIALLAISSSLCSQTAPTLVADG